MAVAWSPGGARSCGSAVFPFGTRQALCARAAGTNAPNADRCAGSFSRAECCFCFCGGIQLWIAPHSRRINTRCVRTTQWRNDCSACDHRNSKYQSTFPARMALGVCVSAGVAFSGDYTVRREAKFVQQHESAKATWREGDKVYMLALEGAPDQLRVIAHEKTARLVQRW